MKQILFIAILFFFSCSPPNPDELDYNFEVIKVERHVEQKYQKVTFKNKYAKYTLICPLEPEYKVGDKVRPNSNVNSNVK